MNISKLHKWVSAVCPIDGVSVGDDSDRSTWSVQYAEEATQEQKDAADAALLTFVGSDAPDSVSARQFKLQLLASGLLDQVDAWIASQPRAVQIAFEYSGSFVRGEPMMAAGFAAMGFTDQQVDTFFAAAAAL
jgi:hypothetical protein